MNLPRSRAFYLIFALLAFAMVLLANAHLVLVASTSQPRCVDHVRTGEAVAASQDFSAASSSC